MRTVPRIYFFHFCSLSLACLLVSRSLAFVCQSKLINSRFCQFGEMIDCHHFEINERENNTTMYRYMVWFVNVQPQVLHRCILLFNCSAHVFSAFYAPVDFFDSSQPSAFIPDTWHSLVNNVIPPLTVDCVCI